MDLCTGLWIKLPRGLRREARRSILWGTQQLPSSKLIKTFLTMCISLLPHNTTSWGFLPFVKKCLKATWCVESFPKDGWIGAMFSFCLRVLAEENLFLNYLPAFRSFLPTWIISMINPQISPEKLTLPDTWLYPVSRYAALRSMSPQRSPSIHCVRSCMDFFLVWLLFPSFSRFSLKSATFVPTHHTFAMTGLLQSYMLIVIRQ